MSTFLLVIGALASFSINSIKPSHYNYSMALLALGCFAVAYGVEACQ